MLSDRRAELVALRTQAVCRLHRLLVELTRGGLARKLGADKVLRTLALLRPDTAVDVVRVQLAHEHVADIQALDTKIKAVSYQIGELVTASGTHLIDVYGIGPVIAGRILAEVENIIRFPSRYHFASYNGTAPIDASSGEQVRHRLSRAGNRRLNHALHMMAVTQIRQPDSPGRGYYERKRLEGKTPKEALRCLNAPPVRRRLLPARRRPGKHNEGVRITYDRNANAAYIRLTDAELEPGRTTLPAELPPGVEGWVVLDWKDNRIVGLEVLDADNRLHHDLVDQAEDITKG